jgi:signal transduction histidine kinase
MLNLMTEFFRQLFATDFTPHAYCIRLPGLILLHEISDLIITLSYFVIPVALLYMVRTRRDLIYPWMFWLFGIFILSCGTTHLLAIYVLWHPAYRLEGFVKAITAAASFPTALLLIRLAPQIRLLPSPALLRDKNAALEREVNERKLAERRLQQVNDELEQRVAERTEALNQSNMELRRVNEDLRQFAWAASHDLQEPLRMVSIYSELAQRRESERLSEDGKFYLQTAAQSAVRMQKLIDGLLAYTEAGRAGGEAPQASAQAALDEARQHLAGAIADSGAIVKRGALPVLAIAHVKLVQVFQNLLSNAIKYRRQDVSPVIEVWAEASSDTEWIISVSDNGIGIEPEYRSRVFHPFERLSNDIPGVGLGLALCQRVIERQGGRIWVESDGADRGSTFRFTLPRAPEA